MSLPDELHDLTVTKIAGLGLMIAGTPFYVLKRKLPHPAGVDKSLLPGIYIAPSRRPGKDEPFQSRQRWRDHNFDLALIAASNRDNLTDLDVFQDTRTEISDFFGKGDTRPFPDRNEVVTYGILPGPVISREAWLLANLDISSITLVFGCVIDEG